MALPGSLNQRIFSSHTGSGTGTLVRMVFVTTGTGMDLSKSLTDKKYESYTTGSGSSIAVRAVSTS